MIPMLAFLSVVAEPAAAPATTSRSPNGAFEIRFDEKGGVARATTADAPALWSVDWTPQSFVLLANDGEQPRDRAAR